MLFLTHPSAVILAPLLLLPVFIALRRGRWRRLLAGLAAALLVALPYLYHDAGRGFPSLRSYLISAGAAVVDLEGPKYILTLASGQYFPTMTGISFRGEWRLPVLPYANELAMLLLALGLIGGAWHALRDRTPPGQAHGLLAISFLVALAMSLRHSMPYYPHYFLITYPLQFLLIAVGAWQLTRLARRLNVVSGAASLAMVGIVAYLAISQVWFFSTYVQYLVSNGPIGVYGPPYRYSAAAARNLQTAMVETGADAIYIYSFLQRQPLDYLIGDNPAVRHIDPPTAAVAPADRTRTSLALLASDEIAVSGHSYNAPADDGAVVRGLKEQGFRELPEYRVVGPYDHTYYRLFVSTGADSVGDGAPQLAAPQNPVQLQTGLRLLGYNPPARLAPGQTGELRLLWQLPEVIDPSPALEYNLFVHLLDSSGKQVVSVDQELYRFASWREEDCMLSIIPIKAPPELSQQALTVRVGAYGRYDRAEVKWELGAGQTSLYLDLGETVVTAKPAAAAQPNIPVRASFSQQLTLLGYSIDSREGDSFNVALHWQAEATMHQNYTVSVQLLDRAGSLVAQHDAQPRGGTYPTRVWESGEVVIDPHSVPLDPKQRPQVTTLRVVVYDGISGGRLPVGSGDAFDQAVSLGKE